MANPTLIVSTYNVLHPYHQNDFDFLPNKGKDWNSRASIIATNILNGAGDIVCLQEISQDHFKDLKGRIGYLYEGFHTKHDGQQGAEKLDGVAIFYLKSRFKLKAIKTCSKTDRSTTPRRDLYIDVEDVKTQHIMRCSSAHIDGNPTNLNVGNQQLKEMIHSLTSKHLQQDYAVDAVALGCDLNEKQDGERFKILKNESFETNVFPSQESEVNRHRQIDWIFFKAVNQRLGLDFQEGIHHELPYGSDHRLVSVQISRRS